jgi:NitT/TauT family transport system substrate-binding protein
MRLGETLYCKSSMLKAGLLLIGAVLLPLTGCGERKAVEARAPIRIAVGGQALSIYLPVTLAGELGFYSDEKLAVTIQDFPGGAKSLEALLGGSTDVVCGFYDHTIQMAAQGRELRAFVAMLRYPGLVAVAAKPGILRIEDLKGKTIGVSSPGSSTHMFLNYLLVTHGLKPDQVSTPSIGMNATAVAAITHGKVDAAIMADPAIEVAQKQMPSLRILADTRSGEGTRAVFGVDTYPSVVLYSTAQWLDGHRAEAKHLAHAVNRTVEWMRTHPPAEIRQKTPPQFRDADEQSDLEGLRFAQTMLSPDGRLTQESAEAVRKVLSVSLDSVRTATIHLDRTYTNEFVTP